MTKDKILSGKLFSLCLPFKLMTINAIWLKKEKRRKKRAHFGFMFLSMNIQPDQTRTYKKTRRENAQMTHIQVQNWKKMGYLCHLEYAGLVIERFQVQGLAAAAGEFSAPGLTFCADTYLVSVLSYVTAVAHKRPQ